MGMEAVYFLSQLDKTFWKILLMHPKKHNHKFTYVDINPQNLKIIKKLLKFNKDIMLPEIMRDHFLFILKRKGIQRAETYEIVNENKHYSVLHELRKIILIGQYLIILKYLHKVTRQKLLNQFLLVKRVILT